MIFTSKSEFCGPEEADVAILGIPFDSTETQRQAKFGPMFFRHAIMDLEGFDPETKGDIWENYKFCDLGDVDVVEGSWKSTAERVDDTIKNLFGKNSRLIPIFIGGDHSISLMTLLTMQRILNSKITVIHLDAHPDLFSDWKGQKYNHATWAYHILNNKNFDLVQMGCRCISKDEYGLWEKTKKEIPRSENPVYLSVDLDVLDPSFAKAVATPEPLGISLKELNSLLKESCKNRIIGFDIVECASRSVDDDAHIIAANIMKKVLGYLWSKKSQ